MGDVSFFLFSAVFLFFCMAFFIVYVFLHTRGKQRAHEADREKLISTFNEELLRAQLEIQEQAFRKISQEIHDNIGQSLSIAKIYLGTLDFGDIGSVRQKTTDSRDMVGKAIRDLRDLSHTLHSDFVADKGLLASIEHELEAVRRADKHSVRLEVQGIPYELGPQTELILFRILQESVGNVLTHADASEISVSVAYLANGLSVDVRDNGRGFSPQAITQAGTGIGLRNMRSRAKLIGAIFNIDSGKGKGTSVSITLPMAKTDPGYE